MGLDKKGGGEVRTVEASNAKFALYILPPKVATTSSCTESGISSADALRTVLPDAPEEGALLMLPTP